MKKPFLAALILTVVVVVGLFSYIVLQRKESVKLVSPEVVESDTPEVEKPEITIDVSKLQFIQWSGSSHLVRYDTMATDGQNVYIRDRNEVYYHVEGADPQTFSGAKVCGESVGNVYFGGSAYFTDRNWVYVNERRIAAIDRSSFEYLGFAWYKSGSVPSEGVPLAYAKDKNFVYFGCGEVLADADPKTFTIFDSDGSDQHFGHAKDEKWVWYGKNVLKGADPKTFIVLPYFGYAKDAYNVWYKDRLLVGANPQAFKSLSEGYALDKNTVWYEGIVVEKADAVTFEVFGQEGERSARDKNNIYHAGVIDAGNTEIEG